MIGPCCALTTGAGGVTRVAGPPTRMLGGIGTIGGIAAVPRALLIASNNCPSPVPTCVLALGSASFSAVPLMPSTKPPKNPGPVKVELGPASSTPWGTACPRLVRYPASLGAPPPKSEPTPCARFVSPVVEPRLPSALSSPPPTAPSPLPTAPAAVLAPSPIADNAGAIHAI